MNHKFSALRAFIRLYNIVSFKTLKKDLRNKNERNCKNFKFYKKLGHSFVIKKITASQKIEIELEL